MMDKKHYSLVIGGIAVAGIATAYLLYNRKEKTKEKSLFGSNSTKMDKEPVQHRPVRVPIPADVREPTSFANFQDCVVTHMALDLQVNFSRQVLSGSVVLTAEVKKDGVDTLVLDTKQLTIQKVKLGGGSRGPRDLDYSFGPEHKYFGSALRISIPADSRSKGSKLLVQVQYETAPGSDCTAAQWLPSAQTAGKKHPYFFTQCQAIHCRSIIPSQDAPVCKTTYEASITVPNPLVALMSAVATTSEIGSDFSKYFFRQAVPMSPYLIALAVGNLESRDIGPRTRVWSEPSMVEFGAYEFADTERYLCAAEQICGPYVWGRYDLLLLPPSFPYGGMENPCLTFVTPTLLAGDRSLTNVVAHEIAHSWSGNLVTNANWEDFWMNEGFTVFIERRIIAKLFGEQRAALLSTIGWQHLEDAVEGYGCSHCFTRLHIPMEDVDPDDSFSSIPYEKGCAFLTYLEQLVGGPQVFEPFLKAHVQRFQYGVVGVDEWKTFFLSYFSSVVDDGVDLGQIDWNTWINGPGLPPVKPEYDTTLIKDAHKTADEWVDQGTSTVGKSWSSDQKVVFIERLINRAADGKPISEDVFNKINAQYGFTETRNAELRFKWFTLGIRLGDRSVFEGAVKLLTEQGRMKFLRPLYQDLFKCGEDGAKLAVETFKEHRSSYHAIAQKMVARDLGVDESEQYE